jgi:hypothetical protein
MHLAFAVAAFNLLADRADPCGDQHSRTDLAIAESSL